MATGGWRANLAGAGSLGRFRVDGSSDPSIPASVRPTKSVPSVIALGYALTRPSADDTPPPLPAHQHSRPYIVCTVDTATVAIASAGLWPGTVLHVLARCA